MDIQKAKDESYLAMRAAGFSQEAAEAAMHAAGSKLEEIAAKSSAPPAAPAPVAPPAVEPTYEELMSDPVLLGKTDPEIVMRVQNAAFAKQRAQLRGVEIH